LTLIAYEIMSSGLALIDYYS